MESEFPISKLRKYKSSIGENHLNNLLDFLYSKKIIDENEYFVIYQYKEKNLRIHEIFKIVNSKPNEVQNVLAFLNEVFPEIEKIEEDEQNFRISSVRGGFPKLPPNYVTRSSLVEDVKNKLIDLEWNQKLVVHGMVGYGKSCLINEVLNEIYIRKCFDNHLFWINIGEHHGKETVFQPLWRLYQTVSNIVQNKTIPCPENIQTLKDMLVDLFLHPRLKNALIILDDACSQEVLTYFDFKCRTVITTQNKNILNAEEGIFVEVKTGFSTNESLELFKKSLNIDYDLPPAAEEIHQVCKGHPMLIALIGSYLKVNAEGARNDNEIWDYMKMMFSKGHYSLNEYDNNGQIPTEKIKKCITKLLVNGLKEFYHDLAIFMSDVNVPPEVLQVLWNKTRFEVQNIMNKFAEKSLIVPFYHNDLKTYIYGIHDIHLNYLKDVTKDRIISLHKKLISGYENITQGNYALLPNDNYTLQYIGYHLYKAELFQKFDIYFDLKFIEVKIRAVGKDDVLRDMQKYEIYITRNEKLLKEKLNQYKEFINRCGNNIYGYEKTDIIQFALGEKKHTMVYKEGLRLAEKSEKLYFQLQRPVDDYDHSTLNIKDDITSACFVDSPRHILIGTANGKIKLFFGESEKEISNFVGHNGAINKLIVSSDKRYFLSISVDRTVILWKFAADSARNSYDFSNSLQDVFLVSPKTKQRLWQDVFTADKGQMKPRKVFQLNEQGDYLISASFCDQFPSVFRIVTGSNLGNVIVWDADTGAKVHETGCRGVCVPSVIYIKRELYDRVIFACDDTIVLYKFNDTIYFNTLHNRDCCVSVFFTDDKIIAVNEKSITVWENYKKNTIFEKVDDEEYHVCSTLTDDSNYLIVSTNLKTVSVWNVEENKLVKNFKSRGQPKSLDTIYDEDKSVHILLIGSDRKSLQQCHILPDDKEPKIADDFKFIPYWKEKTVLTALVSSNNKIQVFSGSLQISETEIMKSKITCTCFSACGQNVIYGLENGEIHVFNLRQKKRICIENNESNDHKSVTSVQSHNPYVNRTSSICSVGSGDSLDVDIFFAGVIISVFDNNTVTVYYEDKSVCHKINKPLIFFKQNNLVLVDNECQIYIWDLISDTFSQIRSILLESVVCTVAYCTRKNLLSLAYKQDNKYCLDVYNVIESNSVGMLKRMKLKDRPMSSEFSCDGSLLAVGMISGDILVWNLNQKFKLIKLLLHNSPVENLLFSPTMEPVLVSLGEYVAWWNLKGFKEVPQVKQRPKSIELLENITSDLSAMNITYWGDRRFVDGTDYLLSCINFNCRTRFVSASKDFNSFLTVDDKGKIYVMEIVISNCA